MDTTEFGNIINLIEHPEIPITLKELGVLSYTKIDNSIVTVIFVLPDINMPNRKDIANSVKIMAESFGYKLKYDFRKMTDEELVKYNSLIKK
jgi:hypothetical protein